MFQNTILVGSLGRVFCSDFEKLYNLSKAVREGIFKKVPNIATEFSVNGEKENILV